MCLCVKCPGIVSGSEMSHPHVRIIKPEFYLCSYLSCLIVWLKKQKKRGLFLYERDLVIRVMFLVVY